jgi:hypothetical protein
LPGDQITNVPVPTIVGMADPASLVTVIVDGTSRGTAAADAAGGWSFTLTTALADGSHLVTAIASDAAGTVSLGSVPLAFVVDTIAPKVAVTRTSPNADGWNNTAVTVDFTATDAGSGFVAGADRSRVVISSEGLAPAITRTFTDIAGNSTSVTVATIRIDLHAPTTTTKVTPVANAAGWHRSAIAVELSATDSLSGVARTEFQLDSGFWTAYTVPVPITSDGPHTLRFRSTDLAGNIESEGSLPVRIDTIAPKLTFGPTAPAPNAAGWNNSDVAIPFTASDDGGSGVAGVSAMSPLAFTSETAGATRTITVTDVAGNTATVISPQVKLDRTPPMTTARPSRPANAKGWYKAPVAVSLTCADALSGCVSTEISLDGAPFESYTGAVNVTAEGIHVLRFRSTDLADNVEAAQTLLVRLDLTPPEAVIRFDPATQDVIVAAKDPADTVTVVMPPAPVPDGKDKEDASEGRRIAPRSYTVTDRADNTLVVVLAVRREGTELKAQVVSLQRNGLAVELAAPNRIAIEWSLARDRSINELEQHFDVGRGRDDQKVEAKYRVAGNVTVIQSRSAEGDRAIRRAGLVLVRIETANGRLRLAFD